jgi:hypothetical protein
MGHGFVMQHLGLGAAEEARMVAANVLALKGDLTAEPAGGKIVLAEIDGFGCGHDDVSLSVVAK